MTGNARGGTRILGSLRSADGKGVVRMEDRYDTDIDDLWSAFTDTSRLARWLGEFEGELRLGGEFRARFFASGWEGTGRVEACEPPRRLLVVTKGSDAPDEHVIEATLAASPAGTARSRATCASAASSTRTLPARGNAPGAWTRASHRGGCC